MDYSKGTLLRGFSENFIDESRKLRDHGKMLKEILMKRTTEKAILQLQSFIRAYTAVKNAEALRKNRKDAILNIQSFIRSFFAVEKIEKLRKFANDKEHEMMITTQRKSLDRFNTKFPSVILEKSGNNTSTSFAHKYCPLEIHDESVFSLLSLTGEHNKSNEELFSGRVSLSQEWNRLFMGDFVTTRRKSTDSDISIESTLVDDKENVECFSDEDTLIYIEKSSKEILEELVLMFSHQIWSQFETNKPPFKVELDCVNYSRDFAELAADLVCEVAEKILSSPRYLCPNMPQIRFFHQVVVSTPTSLAKIIMGSINGNQDISRSKLGSGHKLAPWERYMIAELYKSEKSWIDDLAKQAEVEDISNKLSQIKWSN